MSGDFGDAMTYVRDTAGLILDLRGNLGGIAENVEMVIGRFIESPLESYEARTVEGPVELPAYQPDSLRYAYTGPVVVLINGACASAPEAVAELLQRLPNVTLVGDTTSGAGCWSVPQAPGTVSLPSGRSIYIPTTYMVRQDGEPWEWNGILPDIRVVQTRDHVVQRIDGQLEKAIELLKP
jgi:carboxyl-terminal processing protease